jgi:SAM-dependent methyltransferase
VTRRDIRTSAWYEEIAEHFDVDPALLRAAVPDRRLDERHAPAATREARAILKRRFMAPATIALLDRLEAADPADIADEDRSAVWREYVFLCINGERRAAERRGFYEMVLRAVVAPLAEHRARPLVVDYGCGSSLFTRLIAQDFGGRVATVSADVCRYAVEFSVARNRIYNPHASGRLLDDVRAPLGLRDVDLILAYAVLEHLPNAPVQVQGLVDALAPGGMLIENYSGHSSEIPHKSDTWSAYRSRDTNLALLRRQLTLLHGVLPAERDGVFGHDRGDRFWIKGAADGPLACEVKARLRAENSFATGWARRLVRRVRGMACSA